LVEEHDAKKIIIRSGSSFFITVVCS
jgi:hypothetical protein